MVDNKSGETIWKAIAVVISVILLVFAVGMPATSFKETTNRTLDDHDRRLVQLEKHLNENYQEILKRLPVK